MKESQETHPDTGGTYKLEKSNLDSSGFGEERAEAHAANARSRDSNLMLGMEQTRATCAAALTSRPSAARLRLNVWLHCRQKGRQKHIRCEVPNLLICLLGSFFPSVTSGPDQTNPDQQSPFLLM